MAVCDAVCEEGSSAVSGRPRFPDDTHTHNKPDTNGWLRSKRRSYPHPRHRRHVILAPKMGTAIIKFYALYLAGLS